MEITDWEQAYDNAMRVKYRFCRRNVIKPCSFRRNEDAPKAARGTQFLRTGIG